jgi:hypothetical protein
MGMYPPKLQLNIAPRPRMSWKHRQSTTRTPAQLMPQQALPACTHLLPICSPAVAACSSVVFSKPATGAVFVRLVDLLAGKVSDD